MNPLVARIVRVLGRLTGDSRYLVACSGGGDSVALAWLVREAAEELGFEFALAHVDHGTRPDSEADARFVAGLAERLGAAVFVRKLSLGPVSEDEARRARLSALLEMADEFGAGYVLLGHTADDQAETVLMRLIRGTGLRGLAAMAEVAGRLVRPLLDVRRRELRDYLARRGESWREDSTNQDRRFFRNRIRHDLLPKLAEENPRIVESLVRLARLVRADLEALDAGMAAASAGLVRRAESGGLAATRIAEGLLDRFGRGGLWWTLRRAFADAQSGRGQLEARHLEVILSQRRADLPGGVRVEKSGDAWFVFPALWTTVTATGPWRLATSGVQVLAGTGWRVEAVGELPHGGVWLGCWRPGDRLAGRGKKVQDLFVDRKVPTPLRSRLPLGRLGGPDGPVSWVPGLWPDGSWTWRPSPGVTVSIGALQGSVEWALVALWDTRWSNASYS